MGPRHRELFAAYVTDLRSAADVATTRFEEEVQREVRSGRPVDEARTAVRLQRGPTAADPRVLGVIIQYFFRAARLNEEIEKEGGTDEVQPLVFVHEMLTGRNQELWSFLAELPYLPLGLRRDDSRV